MSWHAMQAADLGMVSAISDAVHGRYTEPEAIYAERLDLYPAGCFVLEGAGGLAGYLISHPWRRMVPPPLGAMLGSVPEEADSYYLHDLALLPSARGTGAGVEATRIVQDQARSAGFAEVFLVAVSGAEKFWAARGFTPVPDEAIAAKLHASYGPEALYMRLPLNPIRI